MSFATCSAILKAQKNGTAEIPFSEHLEPKEDSIVKIFTKTNGKKSRDYERT